MYYEIIWLHLLTLKILVLEIFLILRVVLSDEMAVGLLTQLIVLERFGPLAGKPVNAAS